MSEQMIQLGQTQITCTICGVEKHEDEFPLNGDGHGGRRKQCRECMRKINRDWRRKNKEKVSDYNKNRKNQLPRLPQGEQ